jgi:hypothetical protein
MIMILYSVNDKNEITYIGANMKNRKENWIKDTLKPGRYLLEIRHNIKTFINSFVVSVYGPSNSRIVRTVHQKLKKLKITSCLIEAMQKFSLTNPSNNKKQISSKNMNYSLVDMRNGLGYVIFENNEMDYHLKVFANMKNSKNIEVIYPGTAEELTLEVPGFQKKIIIFVSKGLPYSISVSLSFTMHKERARQERIGMFKKRRLIDLNHNKMEKPQIKKKEKILYFIKNRSNNSNDITFMYESVVEFPVVVKLLFSLGNCYIEDHFKEQINFVLMPKEFYFIVIKRIDGNLGFRAELLAENVEHLS